MSLQGYQQLQTHSQDDPTLLGNRLENLTNGTLAISSTQLSTSEMHRKLISFKATHGWVMYRDEVLISLEMPTRNDVIEGEWTNGNESIKVKLIASDLFQVSEFTATKNESKQLFSVQKVILRNSLQNNEYNCAVYRCWWQQAEDADHNGRWLPLSQQFIGFSNNKAEK